MKAQPLLMTFTALVGLLAHACNLPPPPRVPHRNAVDALGAGDEGTFTLPGVPDRPYFVRIPTDWDGEEALPVVLALHPSGGDTNTFRNRSCPNGDTFHEDCLVPTFDREGAVVVLPNGTGDLVLSDYRSWNAGGGGDTMRCVSARGCDESVDDVAFLDDILAEVHRAVPVNDERIFATGYGNGGAMVHRLACERATIYAAVAAVAGANQVATVQGCFPARPIPVLQIHGDQDPCWGMDGSFTSDCGRDAIGELVPVTTSMEGWRQANACGTAVTTTDVDAIDDDDSTSASLHHHEGCSADVELLLVEGGGHTWPGGNQYAGVEHIGVTSKTINGSAHIASFFRHHSLTAPLGVDNEAQP